MPAALPNIILCLVGGSLLLVGVFDKGQSNAAATGMLTLGSGISVLGVLLQRVIKVRLGPGGCELTLAASHAGPDLAHAPARAPEPSSTGGARRHRNRRAIVLAGIGVIFVLLMVVGAAARSTVAPNYRVPVLDPRADACSWTLSASPRRDVRRARIPRVVGLSPDDATRTLEQARLEVRRDGTIAGECVVKSQSESAGRRLRRGQTITVVLKPKPVDEESAPPPVDRDADDDGYNARSSGGRDCDDHDPAVRPNATEGAGDEVDSDCDGNLDPRPIPDVDGDGHPAPTDCDDDDAAVHPGAMEQAGDAVDSDCDGNLDPPPITDVDGDGHPPPADCDDTNEAVHPGATEQAGDKVDSDCDGETDG